MKKYLIFTLLLVVYFNSNSQSKRINSNVWYSNIRLSGSEIYLNSDSTYFLSHSGCTEISVTKGNWSVNKDTFILSPSYDFELYPKVTYEKSKNFQLTFLDNNNLPVSGLFLTFTGDTSSIFQTTTKDDGKVVLNSTKFNKVYIDGLNNRFYETTKIDSTSIVHLSLVEIGHYIYKFNYSNSLLINIQSVENFYINEEMKFIRTNKNELINLDGGRVYKKKY